ncbi:WecB/TagA/CpsF family glycosyltransferase [Humisphaera borealis]|uniref:WecB/TagA/CpsF family glycosyltransferase n=1 Tax=Humisphaera borealis TaxID=2807512 RepID=A0A7M2WSJ0_9BACT|nr:WecB/TagA/CpsF family glycosyltransferase [Humisphaera borealis]QOV88467.1 WecB/TagA/CpsF family glycosyltransferase [Humisphaera borealis]
MKSSSVTFRARAEVSTSHAAAPAVTPVRFPAKVELFNGVMMTPTTYDDVVDVCINAAKARQPAITAFAANHILAMAAGDEAFRARMNDFDLVAPDGQPVRWAMNYFHDAGLTDRVYGPELTRRLCQAAAERGVSIYLFGATDAVIAKLCENLHAMFPKLVIAGAESPPFRPLTPEEDAAAIKRINDSGAGLLFIGIGAPKQENFAHAHRHSIKAVQLCVGAAFDFHAGVKETAPAWMQKRGLEWLYRLTKEPKRLWKRYFVTNTHYLALFAKHAVLKKLGKFPRQQSTSSRPTDSDLDDELTVAA